MIGLDSTILVAAVHEEHARHQEVADLMNSWADADEQLGLCSHVIAEFLHIVTDSRRFERPITMQEALNKAESWLLADESQWITTGDDMALMATQWISQHRLGRKRILDTFIAATYAAHGIKRLATLNPSDSRVFNTFDFIPSPTP